MDNNFEGFDYSSSKFAYSYEDTSFEDSNKEHFPKAKADENTPLSISQKKNYTDTIHRYLSGVLFRLDIVPVADRIINTILDNFKNEYPNIAFRRQLLDSVLLQRIDGDSVAEILGISLNELLKYEGVLIKNVEIGRYKCDVCIQHFFISVDIAKNSIREIDIDFLILKKDVFEFFNKITKNCIPDLFDRNLFVVLSYNVSATKNDLWEKMDPSAFAFLELKHNAQYRDMVLQEEDPFMAIEIIRNVEFKGNDVKVTVQSKAAEELVGVDIEDKGILDKSKQFITNCFK